MISAPQCVLVAPFFGPLPDYFPFWARSCEINHERFQWIVYSDSVASPRRLNTAVQLVPYSFAQMRSEIGTLLGSPVPECPVRKLCELRILLPLVRREHEQLHRFDFVGYCDLDMVFGNLAAQLPEQLAEYSVLSGHDDRPCGPFTLIRSDAARRLGELSALRDALLKPDYCNFDENPLLTGYLEQFGPVFLSSASLQPSRSGVLRKERCSALWSAEGLTVTDGENTLPAGFFHFTKLKNRKTFCVCPEDASASRWMIDEHGIRAFGRVLPGRWRQFTRKLGSKIRRPHHSLSSSHLL